MTQRGYTTVVMSREAFEANEAQLNRHARQDAEHAAIEQRATIIGEPVLRTTGKVSIPGNDSVDLEEHCLVAFDFEIERPTA